MVNVSVEVSRNEGVVGSVIVVEEVGVGPDVLGSCGNTMFCVALAFDDDDVVVGIEVVLGKG